MHKAISVIQWKIEAELIRKHPEWIKQAHDLGLEVNVWTVDKEEDMKYFLEQGVDYLTTNHPEQALKLVNAK